MTRARLATLGMLVTLATLAAGCERDGEVGVGSGRRQEPADGRRVTPAGGTLALEDAELETLVAHVNNAEIGAAKLALGKVQDARVKAYAQQVLDDHLLLNGALDSGDVHRDTLSKPPATFHTMQVKSRTVATLLRLMPAGPAYDHTYVATQVIDHQDALDSLHHWHASAKGGALRAAIAGAIPKVEQHLARARALQAALGAPLERTTTAPPPRPDTLGQRVESPARDSAP